MARTVIVGDLHACLHELEALLDKVAFAGGDRLVMVGDLVVRGPEPRATMDRLLALSARSARGNHDDRLVRWREDKGRPLGDTHRSAADALRKRHWAFLASLPLWLDLPEHGVRVVHAGLVPGVPIERQDPRTQMYIRCLGPNGEPVERRGDAVWGLRYDGPPHVVFGHNAASEPQIHRSATGLDTGAVYGGRLTAMVLPEGSRPPPPADRGDALVSVPARKRYADA
jgi:diadenosine tetraphosphatase ApaH/serine/threonine PP2A family protein phosphatase